MLKSDKCAGSLDFSEKNQTPMVTIITAVFNGERFIEETILSVINQTYRNIEYIVIDGGSTDSTVNIIKKYENYISYWVSEKDGGISDAFNKGILASSGDYINFQGDGDGFVADDVIERLMKSVDPRKVMLISGRIERVSDKGEHLYFSKKQKKFYKSSLLFRMSLPHQGLFTHRNLFIDYGLFDVKNTFCMDYEHLLRAYKKFPEVVTKDIVVARWRADGIGNKRELEVLAEYDLIKRKNMIAKEIILSLINQWILFKFHVKKILSR
ncbi:glycosyltransferase family 2 protein [Endozoicomonas sp.]|uniref:glycosyltransferase family 2 protein n=1 Tax=Endozoicomonas sp. TaxID=1892382 RepID=UPI003AF97E1A